MRTPLRNAIAALAMISAVAPVLVATPAEARDGRRYHRTDNGVRYWKGNNGRYYCKRKDGTVGTLIGGVAGALVGRAVDTRGERTTGTVLGAAAGALLGREVARGPARCR